MKRELNLFLTALEFYTRIPCGRWVDHRKDQLNEATKYLPVIGWVVGGVSAITYLAVSHLLGTSLAIAISMAVSVLLTGAFHEDGLADFCDGFGGGWTKDRILEIMKDSRTGTYGVTGLVLILLTKFLALQQMVIMVHEQPVVLILLFTTAHSLSRFVGAAFIYTHRYVRLSADSKVKPVAGSISRQSFLVAALFALLPLGISIFYTHWSNLLILVPVLYSWKLYLGWYFNKWIGGYTGDCLGAAQQLAEIIIYLTYISLWKFI